MPPAQTTSGSALLDESIDVRDLAPGPAELLEAKEAVGGLEPPDCDADDADGANADGANSDKAKAGGAKTDGEKENTRARVSRARSEQAVQLVVVILQRVGHLLEGGVLLEGGRHFLRGCSAWRCGLTEDHHRWQPETKSPAQPS